MRLTALLSWQQTVLLLWLYILARHYITCRWWKCDKNLFFGLFGWTWHFTNFEWRMAPIPFMAMKRPMNHCSRTSVNSILLSCKLRNGKNKTILPIILFHIWLITKLSALPWQCYFLCISTPIVWSFSCCNSSFILQWKYYAQSCGFLLVGKWRRRLCQKHLINSLTWIWILYFR